MTKSIQVSGLSKAASSLPSVRSLSVSAAGRAAAAGASPYLYFDFLVAEEGHQVRDDAGVDDHLDLLVARVRQVGQGPHSVHQDLEPKQAESVTLLPVLLRQLNSLDQYTGHL